MNDPRHGTYRHAIAIANSEYAKAATDCDGRLEPIAEQLIVSRLIDSLKHATCDNPTMSPFEEKRA